MIPTQDPPARSPKTRQTGTAFSLEELFQRITHLDYVLLTEEDRLPHDENTPITILTSKLPALTSLWQLTRISDQLYHAQLSTGKLKEITIYEKGKNVFPEQFESCLIQRAYMHSKCIKVPSNQDMPYLRLFWMLVYEGWMKENPSRRGMFLDFVFNYTGMPNRPKYKSLHYCVKKVWQNP